MLEMLSFAPFPTPTTVSGLEKSGSGFICSFIIVFNKGRRGMDVDRSTSAILFRAVLRGSLLDGYRTNARSIKTRHTLIGNRTMDVFISR
ncbi:hypothetical protein [Antarcticirhabdus aurantiaca]|uniref:Uncharacterized protein n=1 Tax=Antarcticirhabdus aurantiaca TaxID=2606717 RepID=A0ACD4NHX5_9HYPH|nr:hypothetical protein [Antarcticirhabdus aurantiaca]WAJ26433.1 hypothetical protein OXU80_16250 [Jeongeuplla avenae]